MLDKVIKKSLSERGDKAKTYTTLFKSKDGVFIVQFERYCLSKNEYKSEDALRKFKEHTLYREAFAIKCDTLLKSLNQLFNLAR